MALTPDGPERVQECTVSHCAVGAEGVHGLVAPGDRERLSLRVGPREISVARVHDRTPKLGAAFEGVAVGYLAAVTHGPDGGLLVHDGLKDETFAAPAPSLDDKEFIAGVARRGEHLALVLERKMRPEERTEADRCGTIFRKHTFDAYDWERDLTVWEKNQAVGRLVSTPAALRLERDGRPPVDLAPDEGNPLLALSKGDWSFVIVGAPAFRVDIIPPHGPPFTHTLRDDDDFGLLYTDSGPFAFNPERGLVRVERSGLVDVAPRKPEHDLAGAPLGEGHFVEKMLQAHGPDGRHLFVERIRGPSCSLEDRVHVFTPATGSITTVASGEGFRMHAGFRGDRFEWVEAQAEYVLVTDPTVGAP